MMKKSPFPGMDPFAERLSLWSDLHGWMIRKLAEQVMSQVRGMGLELSVERSVYRQDDEGLMLIGEPDFLSFQGSVNQDRGWDSPDTAVALAEPKAIHEVVLDDDELHAHKQDYLVVREEDRGMTRVVAVVELLSPANKSGTYAPKYRVKRETFLDSRSHFLEIDLIRDGVNLSRNRFPELQPTPYFIFLARKNDCGRHEEAFPIRLQEALPTIGLPLTPDRPLLPLNLQTAFESAYDLCAFTQDSLYNLAKLPGPALSDDDLAFVNQVLATRSLPVQGSKP